MTTNEKLQKINTAIENCATTKRKTEYYEEMLRDMEDGENVGLQITCKGRLCTLNRIEGVALYSLVRNIIKIGLEESKTNYDKSVLELYKIWNETRGEA